MTGEETSSQSSKFSIFDCLDMGSGTMGCAVKEGVKMYSNNLRSTHIKKASLVATEGTLAEAMSGGLSPDEAAKAAQKAGTKAAKVATKQADRLIGPLASAFWDFFEAMFYGGSLNEGTVRGVGTLFGTYAGGSLGEQWLGKLGYLVGSQLGSWFGGRVGVMVYDVLNGIHFLFRIVDSKTESYEL